MFLCGSIAGGTLRSSGAVETAANLSSALQNFAQCAYSSDSHICERCSIQLLAISEVAQEKIPSAAYFSCSLAESYFIPSDGIIREVANVTRKIVETAIRVRAEYMMKFRPKMSFEVQAYNNCHRDRTGIHPEV